jgi:type IV pilus assembly protein PilV
MNGKNYRARSAARRAMPRARRHAGFSMIELLVAVLVMGIGVLGITALQMVSLQNNRGALMRGEASLRTYDVMDRIRANPSGNYGGVAFGDAPPAANDCMANNCTAAQMTAFDQASWKCSLGMHNADAGCIALRASGALPTIAAQPGLPNGDGSITVNGATGVVSISVRWQEQNAAAPTVISIDSQI